MKTKLFFLVLLFSLKTNISFSQATFGKSSYAGSPSFCIAQGLDSGYTIVSIVSEFLRIDKFGNQIANSYWNQVGQYIRVVNLINTVDSGYLISGYYTDLTSFNKPFIAKTDQQGKMKWISVRDTGTALTSGFISIEAMNSDFISAVIINDSLFGQFKVLIQRTDSAGTLIWTKTIGNQDKFSVGNMIPTNDNGFYLCGTKNGHAFYSKLDSTGMIEWSRSLSDSLNYGTTMSILNDGSFLFMGKMVDSVVKCFLTKVDTSGNVLWYQTYSHPTACWGNKVIERSSGNLIIVGTIDYALGFLLGLDPNGIPQYSWHFSADPSNPSTRNESVIENNDGLLTLFGQGAPGSGNFIFKVDSLGNGICNLQSDTFDLTSFNFTSANDSVFTSAVAISDFTVPFINYTSTRTVSDFCLYTGLESIPENSIEVYPNPTVGNLTVLFLNNDNLVYFEIYNSIGQKVLSKKISENNNEDQIQISFILPNGIYFGKLFFKKGISNFKFTVIE